MSLLNVESYVFVHVFYLVLFCIHVYVDDVIKKKTSLAYDWSILGKLAGKNGQTIQHSTSSYNNYNYNNNAFDLTVKIFQRFVCVIPEKNWKLTWPFDMLFFLSTNAFLQILTIHSELKRNLLVPFWDYENSISDNFVAWFLYT